MRDSINTDILKKLKNIMSSMNGVHYDINNKGVFLLKNKKLFCKLDDKYIYLLNESGFFMSLDFIELDKRDSFLYAATKSYWYASGQRYVKISKYTSLPELLK